MRSSSIGIQPNYIGQYQEHIEILMIFKKRQNKSLEGEARQEL